MAKPSLEPGLMLDGFSIGELLHRGGMASLWEVTKPGDDRPLLMKIPNLQEGEDPAAIVSFEMEQMIMPRLKGTHVPAFVAAGDFAVQPFIVMERLPGKPLITRLPELPLPLDEVVSIGARVADALESIHRQHVVHLDLKPSNIMFRDDGTAVMIDYGLAHHAQLPDLMKEEFRLPYGTAPYMAPEQVLGIRNDPRSDIFALGVLLYFFATGTRPFGEPERLKGLKRRLWMDPTPPRKLKPDLPPWFQEIVLRCLEVKASSRYPTAAQLRFDLTHPDQVHLTERAERMEHDSLLTRLKRRFEPELSLIDVPRNDGAEASDAPIVVVAIDLQAQEQLGPHLRQTVTRILERSPKARLACLNVMKESLITIDAKLDEAGHNRHVQRLVELKEWARPLGLNEGRATYHVLESTDPADSILEYARQNNVDHIVMGARTNSTMRKLLGSVSGKVAAEAPCSVTVVRSRAVPEIDAAP
ncbi:MAG: bifunctional serine/threonine-protein kinase/universal stress protein [Hyphomicrobiales bacterium]